jgi:hypothetical protein
MHEHNQKHLTQQDRVAAEKAIQMAIRYLLKAEELYYFVYVCTEQVDFKLPNTSFSNNYQAHLLEQVGGLSSGGA